MKLNKIAVAVAGVVAASSTYAVNPGVTPTFEVYMSGASAQDKAIKGLFTDLCKPGTLDIYLSTAPKASDFGKDYSSYYCEIDTTKLDSDNASGSIADGDTVIFHKQSKGGSGKGVAPVVNRDTEAHLTVSAANCTSLGNNSDGDEEWECGTASLTPAIPDAGVSDVNPLMFRGLNTPAGDAEVSQSDEDKLVIKSGSAVVFGIPVSKSLRNALQRAQGLTVYDETLANVPSLSTGQIRGLFNGDIKSWDHPLLTFSAGQLLTVNLGTAEEPTSEPYSSGKRLVHVCRRVPGSGTQAQFSAKFLRYPCQDASAEPAAMSGTDVVNGPVVVENPGSGDVSVCFNNAENTAETIVAADQLTDPDNTYWADNWYYNLYLNTGLQWAVGIHALEKGEITSGTAAAPTGWADGANFRFVKVDGVAPSLENVKNGSYYDWVENTFQWLKSSETGAPTGKKLELIETIAKKAADETRLDDLNSGFVHPWGTGAYLSLSTNGNVFTPTNNVNPFTHAASGKTNNCAVPVLD